METTILPTMIPTGCILWQKQLLTPNDLYDRFTEVHVFHQNNQTSKRLLECTECGQLYIYEYTGRADPNDSSLEIVYLPVRKVADQIEADVGGVPRIEVMWPAGQQEPTVQWVRKQSTH
jgi:hypothetical protein